MIVTPSQVAHMLAAADSLAPTPNSPLLPGTMRIAVVFSIRRGCGAASWPA